MESAIQMVAGLIVLATIVRWLVEEFAGAVVKGRVAKALALLLGVLIALFGRIDAMPALGIQGLASPVGYILTGVLIGGGSTIIHALFKRYLPEVDKIKFIK